MTVIVHFVAIAAIAPKAASQGANIVPTIPAHTGISKRVLSSMCINAPMPGKAKKPISQSTTRIIAALTRCS